MGTSEEFNEYTIYKAIKKYPGKPMRGTIVPSKCHHYHLDPTMQGEATLTGSENNLSDKLWLSEENCGYH